MSLMPQRCEGRAAVREWGLETKGAGSTVLPRAQAWETHTEPEGAQGHLRAWEPQAEAAGARLGGVWRAVGWERQGLQNLGWVLGLEPV